MIDWLRTVHVICAGLSFAGFFTRGWWMWRFPERLQWPLVKILPHIVDSLLLASAVGLALSYRFSPFNHPWLLAKIVALLLYIALGMVALKYGRSLSVRVTAWVAALLVFAYIVSVAFTKSPWGALWPLMA